MTKVTEGRHATVTVGEFTVPLIGVPELAVLERCDGCHRRFHLSEVVVSGSFVVLCVRCSSKRESLQGTRSKTLVT